MEQEEQKPSVLISKKDRLKKLVLVLIPLAILFLGWFLFQSKQTNIFKPEASPPPKAEDNLESCNVKKLGNPLLLSPGSYKGIIQSINLNSNNNSADIKLTSANGVQTHTFTVKAENGLAVFNPNTKKDLLLTDLKAGQNVILTANCGQNQDSLFKITQIAIN